MRYLLFLFLPPFVLSCTRIKNENHITIAAAANVQYPIEEIIESFEKKSQIEVKCIIASSGKLTSQIVEGAPFDVFISADTRYPEALHEKDMTFGHPKIYAEGILVLWSMDEDINITGNLDILKDERIKKIALPNPDFAPYGVAAVEALKSQNMYEEVKGKMVYGQNIPQASQYIFTQSVEIGFTSKSVVLSENMKLHTNWREVDNNLYSPIRQAAVLINRKEFNPEAKKFYKFLFSEECRKILQKYGYKLP